MIEKYKLFDSHLHIINCEFPLYANKGYLPPEFTVEDYLTRLSQYQLCGGAVVSGSFQAYDQTYLIDALQKLGPSFVGVTQLPFSVTDQEILNLHNKRIRALRFNIQRGGSENIKHLTSMANRIYDLSGWHVELYIDSIHLESLYTTLINLPRVSIDHLGLTNNGFKWLCKLAEKGLRIKATGFSRVDFDVKNALKTLYSINPNCLMFGTDLPSTRAPKPYCNKDFLLVLDALGENAALQVFSKNAIDYYT